MKNRKNMPSKKSSISKEAMPVEMIKEDHQTVKELFQQFEKASKSEQKEKIVRMAIEELKVHAALEEELFYPAVREELGDEEEMTELLDEAAEEHHVVKFLIKELDEMAPEDERFDAKFIVLAENVKHHIKEEESEMLPKAKKTQANSEDMAEQMRTRKEELQQEAEEIYKKAA